MDTAIRLRRNDSFDKQAGEDALCGADVSVLLHEVKPVDAAIAAPE
ncbi:MAG: hypothetical protein ACYTE5_10955 [Planctomycetota bacterium]